jgi:hypothetical protein
MSNDCSIKANLKIASEVIYLTNACGEITGNGEIVLEEHDFNKVAFEGGPGCVLPYIAEIDGKAYVLGNLEVAFQHPHWDNENLISEAEAALYCKAACEYIQPRLKEGQKLFLADDEFPDRDIIQVAIPLSAMRNAEATTAALKDAFGVVANIPDMPFVDEPTQEVDTIDITPTWGEWGTLYRRFAESGETKAIKALRKDFAKAMASAEALNSIRESLNDEQEKVVSKVLARELAKQDIKKEK